MVISTMKIVVTDQERDKALPVLRGLIGPTRAEAGCINCFLCENVMKPGEICFATKWADQQVLDRYVLSPLYGRVLAVMEMASQEPEVFFNTVSETRGMDYVASVRCGEDAGEGAIEGAPNP